MVDTGGPDSVRKCPGIALADLGDVEGFDKSGEEDQLYAFQQSDGVFKRKKPPKSHQRGDWVAKIRRVELSDVDILHAVHTLAFTGSKWVAFAEPIQQKGLLTD